MTKVMHYHSANLMFLIVCLLAGGAFFLCSYTICIKSSIFTI